MKRRSLVLWQGKNANVGLLGQIDRMLTVPAFRKTVEVRPATPRRV